jgi:N-acyl homoserine lactone hydrolase
MRRARLVRRAVAALALAALLALAWTFLPMRLPEPAPFAGEWPPATPPPGMSLSVLPSGRIEARAAFAFRGGSFAELRPFVLAAVLVRHPRGDLLIDTGLGRDVETHVTLSPRLGRAFMQLERGTPAGDQLRAQGIEPSALAGVVLTHAHWDHVSGLDALPGAPVWIAAEEQDFLAVGGEHTALARHLETVGWQRYGFDGGPYLGFARSRDVWGDGSVVLVPAPGHTPGSTLVFVTLPSGARYAFVGDLVWQGEGIERPAERPWLARWMLHEDDAAVRAAIGRVVALERRFPELTVVPAHDAQALATIEEFPAVTQ